MFDRQKNSWNAKQIGAPHVLNPTYDFGVEAVSWISPTDKIAYRAILTQAAVAADVTNLPPYPGLHEYDTTLGCPGTSCYNSSRGYSELYENDITLGCLGTTHGSFGRYYFTTLLRVAWAPYYVTLGYPGTSYYNSFRRYYVTTLLRAVQVW